MPVLKDEICCWIDTMNPSEHHQRVAMRVLSGTPAMCMAMAWPKWRECVPTSSGVNPSLAAPTCWVSSLMTEMIFEALIEQIP